MQKTTELAHLSDSELLAALTGTNTSTAREKLATYGSLSRLTETDSVDLLPPAMQKRIGAALELQGRIAKERAICNTLDSPEDIHAAMAPQMQHLSCESLRVILLDTRLRATRFVTISDGSLNETIAHPRDIIRPAIIHRTYALVLVHNHPSGDPRPSRADKDLTRRVAEAADLLQVLMLDHVIIGKPGNLHDSYFSFKEAGLI